MHCPGCAESSPVVAASSFLPAWEKACYLRLPMPASRKHATPIECSAYAGGPVDICLLGALFHAEAAPRLRVRGVFWSFAALTAAAAALVKYMPNGAQARAVPVTEIGKKGLSRHSLIVWPDCSPTSSPKARMGLPGPDRHRQAIRYQPCGEGSCGQFDRRAAGRHSGIVARHSVWPDQAAALLHAVYRGQFGSIQRTDRLRVFAAMVCLFNFAWNLAVPYQFGALSQIDTSRRTVALASGISYAD